MERHCHLAWVTMFLFFDVETWTCQKIPCKIIFGVWLLQNLFQLKMSPILNLSLSGILVSMLKKEKKKVQEASARLANFSGGEITSHSSSTSSLDEKSLKDETSEIYTHAQQLMNRQRGEWPLTRTHFLRLTSLHALNLDGWNALWMSFCLIWSI